MQKNPEVIWGRHYAECSEVAFERGDAYCIDLYFSIQVLFVAVLFGKVLFVQYNIGLKFPLIILGEKLVITSLFCLEVEHGIFILLNFHRDFGVFRSSIPMKWQFKNLKSLLFPIS